MNLPTPAEVAQQVGKQGYCAVPGFLSKERMGTFMPEVMRRFDRLSHNGAIGHVLAGTQKFLQHTLMVHEEILGIYIDPFIVGCAEAYSGTDVHLQDYRIYQNLGGCKMHWHVDNKCPAGDGMAELLKHKGLIIVIYLSDSPHGSFQFVSGSHEWSWEKNLEDWESHQDTFQEDIVTFNEPAGTLVMFDFRGIHRAKPFDHGEPRTACFAQYAPTTSPAGEPIFVDTGMLDGLTEKQMQVLRFGRPASAPTWPIPADHVHEGRLQSFTNKVKRKVKGIIGG
jgi:hypothetical protein